MSARQMQPRSVHTDERLAGSLFRSGGSRRLPDATVGFQICVSGSGELTATVGSDDEREWWRRTARG